MLATVRSQVARAPLTVLLQQRRLLRHMASGALSRVPGRVFPLLAESAGGPGRTGAPSPASIVRFAIVICGAKGAEYRMLH